MFSRVPTIGFPLLALAVAMILVSHDFVMTMGPHDVAAQASHDHHMSAHPMGDLLPSDAEPVDHATACGAFDAARAPDRQDFDGDTILGGRPDSYLIADESEQVMTAPAEPGAPPKQIRAMLQVFLN